MVLVSNPFGGLYKQSVTKNAGVSGGANPTGYTTAFGGRTPSTGSNNSGTNSYRVPTLSANSTLDNAIATAPQTATGGIASKMLQLLRGQKAGQDSAIEAARKDILTSAQRFRAALGLDSQNAENAAANGYGLRGGTFAQQQSAVNTVKNQNFSKALQLEGQTANSIAGLAGQKAQLETQVGGQALNVIAQTELAEEQQKKANDAQAALMKLQASLK